MLGIRERERQRERDREREAKRDAEGAEAEEEGEESGGDKQDDASNNGGGSNGNGNKKEENPAMQMSLNEYKAVEFVRKLIERVSRSGAPGGVTVANLGGYANATLLSY